ncbi:MAG TPA: hypothetical protein PK490_16875 [Prosthecobacter sp.]|nr:hypothetical protein [Prosthecobacter sp.]HRK15960.1 hypothetical protein [Prosthecobacter sp.]
MPFRPPGQCPVCGEWVPRGAAACDDCGACAKSGWKDDAETYDGLDLPDEDFDYDDFIKREFDNRARQLGGPTREQLWRWVGLAVFIVMVLGYLISVFR